MRKRNFHEMETPSVIIIPMIDIMLFLLVFFMISTMYRVDVNGLPVSLPGAAHGERPAEKKVVPITIDQEGRVFYDKDKEPAEQVKEKAQASLMTGADTSFVIRADEKTDYAAVASVLDSLKAAGAQHVSLAGGRGKG